MDNISLSIPNDPEVLQKAADFLAALAGYQPMMRKVTKPDPKPAPTTAPEQVGAAETLPEAAAVATTETTPTPTPADDTATAPTPAVDVDGVPWDSRIHSDAQVKLDKQGRWKKRRGVQPMVYSQVMAELRAVVAAEPAVAPPPPPPVAEPAVTPPPPPAPAAEPAVTPPPPPPVAEAAATPPPTAAAPAVGVNKFIQFCGKLEARGLQHHMVSQVLGMIRPGVTMETLLNQPDVDNLIDEAAAKLWPGEANA